jgi:hypothetical protein
MAISFVFLVVFLVIQTCGKIWCAQLALCVESCVVLDHTPGSSLLCALACNALVPPWFGIVDGAANMRNGTLFARGLMMLITLFVWLQYLNDFIFARVLVAFFMTNLLLVMLRHKSLDNNPGLLERHLAFFNAMISFLSGLLLTHICTSTIGCYLLKVM